MDTGAISDIRRQRILVRGVVQGVGYRPFVYRLALELGLGGHVGNNTDGVTIEAEGPGLNLAEFVRRLSAEAPPMARVDAISAEDCALAGDSTFAIVMSAVLGQVSTGIPADAATCADCLHELLDPADRRYRYPFINCTNCGPRFTITRRIPYDRPQTSMAVFPMCPECRSEYDDPLNRRFHAQPNACWQCGPRVWLCDATGTEISAQDPIANAIERLLDGEVMAVKGIGGFHLAVDATNEAAVLRLRERKRRYGKPLAIMVRDLDVARRLCELSAEAERLLLSTARPIVLTRACAENGIAPSVAPGIPWIGIYLPYAPLQHLLFANERVDALVMTSANLSEEPIAIDNDEARQRLGGIADVFLMHNREILQRCDDSVLAVVDMNPQVIRRARGYVPMGIPLPMNAPPLLAAGGHLKNVFTLARGNFAYQSQHLGDLENVAGLEFFEHSLRHLMHTFEIEPEIVVHDLHPGYLSTTWARQWAEQRGLHTLAVQHHHAHIAACMAEHAVTEPVIGLSLDGTGFGTDGRIWGGEVLIAELHRFERFAHLDYAPMPGGDAAVKEPWRMAFGMLSAAGFSMHEAAELTGTPDHEARIASRMIERELNTPLTSSLGRLFDAVSAVVLRRRTVDYDAQAAIELEGIAVDEPDAAPEERYVPELRASNAALVLNTQRLWHAVVDDLRGAIPNTAISAKFHAGIAEGFIRAARAAGEKTGIQTIALSGGCMHNRRLAHALRSGLERYGFRVLTQRILSPGDGGLSYGQATVAAAIMNRS